MRNGTTLTSVSLVLLGLTTIIRKADSLHCDLRPPFSRQSLFSVFSVFGCQFGEIKLCVCYLKRKDLFVIKGRKPLTHHISSITITTKYTQAIKMNKLTMYIIKPHRTSISCK